MATAQETSSEEVLRMLEAQQSPLVAPQPAAPAAQAATSTPQEMSDDEVLAFVEGGEVEEEDPREVALKVATSMYDWRNPAPDRETFFANKTTLAELKKQGVEAAGPGMAAMAQDLFVSAADAISSAVWKYDPANEGAITARNVADFVTRGMYSNLQGKPSTFNPGAAMINTGMRAGATLAGANEFNLDFYKTLARGLAATNPKYRVEETGEFVYPGAMMPDAGMGDTTFDLIQMYKQQGKTLRPTNEEDLRDLEYEQFLQKRDATKKLETLLEQGTASGTGTVARSIGVPEQIVGAGGNLVDGINEAVDMAARASGLAPAGYRTADLPWNQPQRPVESQAMLTSMLIDPGAIAAGTLAPVRFGLTAAVKGATARTLEVTAKAAQATANLGNKGAKGAAIARKAKRLGTALVGGGAANVIGQNIDSEAADEALRMLNYGLGAYGALVGGGVVLRSYGKYAGKAAYVLRESIGPGNALDKGARAAVAVNPDVPLRYKDPLVRPSMYTSMESTPARLAQDVSLSPRARKLFGTLADWRAVQTVRGGSAAVSGAAKGVLANVPFSEPLRAAGEEDAANLMLGLGAVIGAPAGVASRYAGTAARRVSATDSDIGRMLGEIQQVGTQRPPERAPRANPDAEVMRTLTEVELAGGDVSAVVKNLSPEQLAEFAAVQGYFRDTVDMVPLNRADFDENMSFLKSNPEGSPIFFHGPEGERPRVFVNVEDAGSIKAGDLGRAFLKSDTMPDVQKAAMINGVETLYTPEQIAARERQIAKAEIEARYAKTGVKVGDNDPEVDLRLAMLRAKSQQEFGNSNAWSRQAIAADDLANGVVDWNRMRRALPMGENPITYLENILGAQARGLMVSGVRIDPETGRPLDTPESIRRTNPAAADDPSVVAATKNYTDGYNKMRRDPANETPVTEPVSPERAAQIELSMTDAPLRAQQIMDLAGGPDGPTLTPTDPNFGWRQEGNRRILAGTRLPDRVRFANHWKPHFEMIDQVQQAMDGRTPVAVRFDAIGPSSDVTKRQGPQYGATTREGIIVRWQATTGRKREKYKGGGNLNVLIADYTTLRNRAMTVLDAKHPSLDPANGGPGASLAAIMADADTYLANKARGGDLGTGLSPTRLRVVEGLVEGRGGNIYDGLIPRDGIWRTPRLELIESIQPTGRRGHNMVSNNPDGSFTQPPPKPMPDMGSDVVPDAPDFKASSAAERIKRNLGSQSGAVDVSILADLVDYGRSIYRAGMDAAAWTANMIKQFGERIRPFLKQAFDSVVQAYRQSRFSDTTGAVNVTGMNRGAATPAADAPPFYLKSSQALDAKVQGKAATVDQIKAILTNPQNGIKAEELKWTGVMQEVERLAKENNGKVPKDALLRYLAEDGAVRLEEVRLGQDKSRINAESPYAIPEVMRYAQENQGNAPEAMLLAIENDGDVYRALGRRTPELLEREDWAQVVVNDVFGGGDNVQLGRYAQYQLPGGENYREVVLAMPKQSAGFAVYKRPDGKFGIKDASGAIVKDSQGNDAFWSQSSSAEWAASTRDSGVNFTSTHFDTPNYVAHMRLNERVDAKGKQGLFIEELQNDRANSWVAARDKWVKQNHPTKKFAEINSAEQEKAREFARSQVSVGPFTENQGAWISQLFKRALRDAVADGKEWVGWTTGETQAARFDLSKQISKVLLVDTDGGNQFLYAYGLDGNEVIRRDVRGENIADIIGKEAAEKLANAPKKKQPNGASERALQGVDLKVGGEDKINTYDRVAVNEVAKYVKQWGGQVEKVDVATRATIDTPQALETVRYIRGQGGVTAASRSMEQAAKVNSLLAQLERRMSQDRISFADAWTEIPNSMAKNDLKSVLGFRGIKGIASLDEIKPVAVWRVNITPQMREGIKKAGQALFVGGAAAVVAEDQLEQ